MIKLQPPNNVPIVDITERPSVVMARWMTDVSSLLSQGISSVNGVEPGSDGDIIVTTDNVPQGDVNYYITVFDQVKLDSIEYGAQVNAVNSVNGKTGDVILTGDDITGLVSSVNGQTGAVDLRTYLECGDASGISPDYGFRVDGGTATTEFNPLIPAAGGQDANDD